MITKKNLDQIELNAVNQGYEGWEEVVQLCREYAYLIQKQQEQGDLFVVGVRSGHAQMQEFVDYERARADRLANEIKIAEREAQEAYDRQQKGQGE